MAAGWMFAIRQGLAPNEWISLNWACAPSSAFPDPIVRLGRFRDRMKSYLRRVAPKLPLVWIEVREKPRQEGEGVHMAVLVPQDSRSIFRELVARWVEADADNFEPGAVDVRPVGARWWDRRDYMLKGGGPDVCARFNTRRFHKPHQGVIYGPRVRISHSIGPKARRDAEKALEAVLSALTTSLTKWG